MIPLGEDDGLEEIEPEVIPELGAPLDILDVTTPGPQGPPGPPIDWGDTEESIPTIPGDPIPDPE